MSKKVIESYRRRLATEEGWTLKRGAKLRVALCYPNVYGVGMANLAAAHQWCNKVRGTRPVATVRNELASTLRNDAGPAWTW